MIGALPDKCVALVLEDSDLLNGTEVCEGFLEQFFRESVGDAAAVDGAVGGARLVVDLVEGQRLRVGCKKKQQHWWHQVVNTILHLIAKVKRHWILMVPGLETALEQ